MERSTHQINVLNCYNGYIAYTKIIRRTRTPKEKRVEEVCVKLSSYHTQLHHTFRGQPGGDGLAARLLIMYLVFPYWAERTPSSQIVS